MRLENKHLHTHRVAVNAYLIRNGKFLLLKRTTDPKIWVPPGGRLKIDEDPVKGLIREVKEETGLDIEVIAPVNTWFGRWKDTWLLSIDYLTYATAGQLTLSSEHDHSYWISLEELENGYPVKLNDRLGFGLADFKLAWKLNLIHTSDPID
jgi:8-oxo-dGTP diphosphatase